MEVPGQTILRYTDYFWLTALLGLGLLVGGIIFLTGLKFVLGIGFLVLSACLLSCASLLFRDLVVKETLFNEECNR